MEQLSRKHRTLSKSFGRKQSSAGQVSLIGDLPGYNFGLLGQKCRIIQKNGEKTVCNLNISD